MSSVFEGGEGVTKGGREDRSRESGVPGPLEGFDMPFEVGDAVGDAGGVIVEAAVMISSSLQMQKTEQPKTVVHVENIVLRQ